MSRGRGIGGAGKSGGEALSRIKGAVNSIRDMNTQIAAASEEQSSVSDEITRNIVSVHEISQSTTLVARDTAQIATHVATLVDKLGIWPGSSRMVPTCGWC